MSPFQQPTSTTVVVSSRRRDALLASLVHIVPLVVTVLVLCLSILNVYWDDLGSPHQNVILQAWQFAAKGHEIFIVASISTIVLHRMHYDLCASDGVPLGLLAGGYQLSTVSHLWSSEFWAGILARPSVSRWPSLGFIIGSGIFLSAVANPASAIAMIPRLDWWDVPRHFFNTPDHKPSSYYWQGGVSANWPPNVTVDMLPSGCYDETAHDLTMCPYQGFDSVANWVSNYVSLGSQPNITITNYNIIRYLSASTYSDSSMTYPMESGFTASTTVSIRDARDLGDYWDYVNTDDLSIESISRLTLSPFTPDGTGFWKPIVEVQCSAYYDAYSLREIEFPHSYLSGWPLEEHQNDSWKMPVDFSGSFSASNSSRPMFNETFPNYRLQDQIYFEWVDLTKFDGAPSLGAIAVFQTYNGSTAVVPCTVDAHWAPVSISLDPTYRGVIYQDSPNPGIQLAEDHSNTERTAMKRVSIEKAWADTMDRPINGTRGGELIFSTNIRALIAGFGGYVVGNDTFTIQGEEVHSGEYQSTIPWRISVALGMYLTEGLASIHINDSLIYHDYTNATWVASLNDLNEPYRYPGSPELSFPDYAASQGFTEVRMHVKRYGYGWGFRGTPIKFAAAVLLMQSLMAVVHILVILGGGWTCAGWTSLAQMLVLALVSVPPRALGNKSVGKRTKKTWKKGIAIRESRGDVSPNLHLVVDDEQRYESGFEVAGAKPEKLAKYR